MRTALTAAFLDELEKIAAERIGFPSSEHAALRKRLDAGKMIYTTRISSERGKYRRGQLLTSPLGALKVRSVRKIKGIQRHPFRAELTAGQRKQIGDHRFDLVRLEKVGARRRRKKPSHVLITGLPGSGKTTLAKRRAKELGLPLISLDGLAAKNSKWAGTRDARKFIRKLDTPHVIEGTQLLGFRKRDLRGHQVHILEEPKSVLVDRLVRRGWNDSSGTLHKGEDARARTEAFHDQLSSALQNFKRSRK